MSEVARCVEDENIFLVCSFLFLLTLAKNMNRPLKIASQTKRFFLVERNLFATQPDRVQLPIAY